MPKPFKLELPETIFLYCDYGKHGMAFDEGSPADELPDLIARIASGELCQVRAVCRAIPDEGSFRDISEDVAHAVAKLGTWRDPLCVKAAAYCNLHGVHPYYVEDEPTDSFGDRVDWERANTMGDGARP